MPFAPQECLKALKTMYNNYCAGPETRLWGTYGFKDAFKPHNSWFGPDYIGIDQGPIVLMIENYFTQRVWNVFMKSPYIQTGLQRAGFQKVTAVQPERSLPTAFALHQNFPNPFNPSTNIEYDLPRDSDVRLSVTDVVGKEIAVLVNERQYAGRHSVSFATANRSLPSGIYFYSLHASGTVMTRKMLLIK